ncbi:flagellar basal-body MS-ring/collar protein FliF [Novosphingopyxis sp.]|uniref:flagellar basal-body MS-ring/collar protein FliF n=1 Tax=Novosphingopyxis sp. TaxID=2709690 RepID=UPI003B5AB55D
MTSERRQLFVIGAIFAACVAALALAYFLFLRPDYAVLYTELRPSDAAAIVEALDKKGVPQELGDGGTSISVPEDRLNEASVAVAGADLELNGDVGFELFNESDMGLTEFAQKINYQRALQGELARTIMAMDGIETARVHLALPERTLFRRAQSEPKAAITIYMKRGAAIAEDRVQGIQRLVAFAVPDLAENEVAVLDKNGRVVSAAPVAADGFAEMGEQSALEQYYAARARTAIGQVLPGFHYRLAVHAFPAGNSPAPSTDQALGSPMTADQRNFRLSVEITSSSEINSEDRAIVEQRVVDALALDRDLGDNLRFAVGSISSDTLAAASTLPASAEQGGYAQEPPVPDGGTGMWPYLLLAAALAAALLLLSLWNRRGVLSDEESRSLAELLGQRLDRDQDERHAAV